MFYIFKLHVILNFIGTKTTPKCPRIQDIDVKIQKLWFGLQIHFTIISMVFDAVKLHYLKL